MDFELFSDICLILIIILIFKVHSRADFLFSHLFMLHVFKFNFHLKLSFIFTLDAENDEKYK